jgi:hypothetical protein
MDRLRETPQQSDAAREARLRLLEDALATSETLGESKNTVFKRGDDSCQVEYDRQGQISRITENVNGRTTVIEAGKDFKSGDATIGKDGSITIKSPDGKMSHTLKQDFSCTTKILGEKGDGSDDKVVRVRTKEGVDREIRYDDKGQAAVIIDRLKTNSGRELVETTTRLGNSNVWNFESNYGRGGQRTNLLLDREGNYAAQEIKRSRPNDLVDTDNSDGMHRDLVSARRRLAEIAANHGVFNGNESTVDRWARKFEQRCRDRAHDGMRAPTDQQIIKTYDYLERILKGSGNNIGSTSRRFLVESALREYAEPTKYINQGSHPSCCLAATERHVVETMPDDHARVLYEAITFKSVTSKLRDSRTGKFLRLNLNDRQIALDSESASVGRGNGWGAAWSYSNKVFQIAAIKLAYPGYSGNGHGFPGASIDQARRANKFICGENTIPLVNRWYGGKPSFSSLQNALKNGTVHYFVPGHAMSIDKAVIHNGEAYVHVDNWWGGSGDGWRRWSRV